MANQDKPANESVAVCRHSQAKRKNNPPAGLASQGKVAEKPVLRYGYNSYLPPALRFDATRASDTLPELLQTARQRALTADEAGIHQISRPPLCRVGDVADSGRHRSWPSSRGGA